MHLSPEIAADLAESRVDGNVKTFWMRHIEDCADCEKELRAWGRMIEALPRRRLEDAPAQVIEQAAAILLRNRSAAAEGPVKSPGSTKILATVVFDSSLEPALAGARGTVGARQVVLEAETFDVHAKIWMDQDQRHLNGQILPRGGKDCIRSARVHLLRDGERTDTATSDNFGEFEFKDIPRGPLGLQIDLPHLTVVGLLQSGDGTHAE